MKRSINVGSMVCATWAALACCAVLLSAQQIEPSGQAPKPVAVQAPAADQVKALEAQLAELKTQIATMQGAAEGQALVNAAKAPAATAAPAKPQPLTAAQVADLNARVDVAIDQAHGAGTGVCGPGKKGRKRELVIALDMETGRVSSHCEERFAK